MNDTDAGSRPAGRGGPLRASIAVGLIGAVLALAAGLAFAVTRSPAYDAQTQLVVLPSSSLDSTVRADYYETLSRGQIVATFAEVAQNHGFAGQAEAALGLTAAQQAATKVTVTVVPSTSLLLIQVTGPDAPTIERVADRTADAVISYINDLDQPYSVRQVRSATGSATSTGTQPAVLDGLAVVVALIVGLALQQAVYQVAGATRRDREEGQGPGEPAHSAGTDRWAAGWPADVVAGESARPAPNGYSPASNGYAPAANGYSPAPNGYSPAGATGPIPQSSPIPANGHAPGPRNRRIETDSTDGPGRRPDPSAGRLPPT